MDWERWYRKYVPSPARFDQLWALHLCMYHNAHVGKADHLQVKDFMPYYDPMEEDITLDDLLGKIGVKPT